MLNNRLRLKRLAHLPPPYRQAFIFTIDVTVIASLNCHWVSQDEDGDNIFWTKQLACWNLLSLEPGELNKARRGIRNVIEYARRISFGDVHADLAALLALRLAPVPTSLPDIASDNRILLEEQSASPFGHAVRDDNVGSNDGNDVEPTLSVRKVPQDPAAPPTPTSVRPSQTLPPERDHSSSATSTSNHRRRKPTPSMEYTSGRPKK